MEEFDLSFFVFLIATATFVQLLATWLPKVIFFTFQGTHGNYCSHQVLEAHICAGANALGETLEAVAWTGAEKWQLED